MRLRATVLLDVKRQEKFARLHSFQYAVEFLAISYYGGYLVSNILGLKSNDTHIVFELPGGYLFNYFQLSFIITLGSAIVWVGLRILVPVAYRNWRFRNSQKRNSSS